MRSALQSADADPVTLFFISIPIEDYRSLLLDTHNPINAAFPGRHKRFIRST